MARKPDHVARAKDALKKAHDHLEYLQGAKDKKDESKGMKKYEKDKKKPYYQDKKDRKAESKGMKKYEKKKSK